RQIVQNAAVNVELLLSIANGAEESRQRHRRTQRLAQRTFFEHSFLVRIIAAFVPKNVLRAGGHVYSDTAKWNRQIIEALEVRVIARDVVQDQADSMAGIKALRQAKPFAQSEGQRVGIRAPVLLAPEGKVAIINSIVEDRVPVNQCYGVTNFFRA